MAAAHGAIPAVRPRSGWCTGTPEIYFSKAIDNSRLVKVSDPRRNQEMRQFGVVMCCLVLLVFSYAWQHFKAIEYGYKVESLNNQREGLLEENRALRLEEASLRSPERIDQIARSLDLRPPQAGQVLRLDTDLPESAAPVMASVTPISVVSVP